ncbi:hypothetical protein KV097_05155 [Mumia sp. zg.B17]|uniref:hypothetical protein n=1 Tax=Mumia sp. zg.B17 TaxID=2855446 RepID=UPI001C6EA308|nr:hypothetical protein [Mumia sp. zg.B17]MBW9205325.1 hypothetical protein [Mumia sp. zg.B17]
MLDDHATTTATGRSVPELALVDLDEQALERWASNGVLIERVMQRCSAREEFPVASGSSLSADDITSGPYATSQTLRRCLTAGIDHLHAVKTLVVDADAPHSAATWSLAHGALENLATAYWILGPASRDDRIERTLRWHAQDIADSEAATRHLRLPSLPPAEARLISLEMVARRRRLDVDEVRRGYRVETAVAYADAQLPRPSLGVLLPWTLGSAFAHGRPWAALGAPTNALLPALAALQLLEAFLALYEQRARNALV